MLYVSTIEPYKHHFPVIDAVVKVRAEGFPVVLKLIGGAKPADDNRLKKKMQNIDSLGNFLNIMVMFRTKTYHLSILMQTFLYLRQVVKTCTSL